MTGAVIGFYGATGHTGRLVAAELKARGHDQMILAGRDLSKLRKLADEIGPGRGSPSPGELAEFSITYVGGS